MKRRNHWLASLLERGGTTGTPGHRNQSFVPSYVRTFLPSSLRRFVASAPLLVAAVAPVSGTACGRNPTFLNSTASLGGATAGERGKVGVLLINNTPHQAVLTLGTFDYGDNQQLAGQPVLEPDFEQFGLGPHARILEGNSTSEILSIECGRVFSVGGPRLLALIGEDLFDADDGATSELALPVALFEGVEFFSATAEEPDQEEPGEPISEGRAPPLEALLGVDFPCSALLILRLEFDDLGPDPFRVDFELIPSETGR